jgi:RNA polymerase sigma-70 factor (ECF subfamily)
MLLLRGLRSGNESALERVVERYTAYVCVIVRNTAGSALTREDVEEVASDVFLALWDNAERADSLKAYIAATARNKARNKLREAAESLPLDDGVLADGGAALDEALISEDERQTVKSAVLSMEETDREIFLRHYYGSQSVSDIARETGVSKAAVKQRLVRGRKKLRLVLEKEVFS